jgi:hypothetical protein
VLRRDSSSRLAVCAAAQSSAPLCRILVLFAIVCGALRSAICINAHHTHRAVDTHPVCKFTDDFDGILGTEVDNLGALILRHFQTRGERIHDNDAAGAE